jgi:extracellular factor (EF) 3-hydroxypalmitic acid methyl ester biosynthesis protein
MASSVENPVEHHSAEAHTPRAPRQTIETSGSASTQRARVLRGHRVRVEDLGLDAIHVTTRHSAIGEVQGEVVDLSLYGVGVCLRDRAAHAGLMLAGDRLSQVRIETRFSVVHDGAAIVRRVSEHNADLIVGLQLTGGGLDLSQLYRHSTRHSISERWQAVDRMARFENISDEFKSWVASLRAYLQSVAAFLAAEEKTLESEDHATRAAIEDEILGAVAPQVVARLNAAVAQLGPMVSDLSEEDHTAYRAFCRTYLQTFFSRAPFMRRADQKPLGYAGDYEMMNMLYRNHAEGSDLLGKILNMYATQEAAARANINRVSYLMQHIERIALQATERARIASIGCGPAYEFFRLLTDNPLIGSHLDVALIDQELRSIEYCERSLSPLARRTNARFHFIRESVRRLLVGRQLSATLGQRDLIYCAGLFDYLSERSFKVLLSALYEALAPGGTLVIGNVAQENPSRWAMEYFSEWFLIHRSREQLREFGQVLAENPTSMTVESEPLGVNLFLVIRK